MTDRTRRAGTAAGGGGSREPTATVRYGPHPDQLVDLWSPAGASVTPVVFIHGGFWRAAYDRSHATPLAADLAARGHPVAMVEYRRVGHDGGGWPGTFDDVTAAIAAATGDDRPVVVGHSAGGHLALWYAKQAPHKVRGVVGLAPVADLGLAHRLGLGNGAVGELLGAGPDGEPDRYAAADPARHLPLGVPAVIVHGADDDVVPVSVSRSYVSAARASGGRTWLTELPQVEHFGVIDPRSRAWPAVLDAIAAVSRDA
jgi:acetyl esterase/lipase